MKKQHLIEFKGMPHKLETEVLKSKTKETLIYGNKNSGDYFVFDNNVLVKYVDR